MFNKLKQTKEVKKQTKELEENVERLRRKISSTFYPWLKEKAENIEDASILCQVLAGHIHTGFNTLVKKVKISELGLDEIMKGDEDAKKYQEAYEMVKDETVADALLIFEGMPKAINACVNKELKCRKLNELKELEDDFK